MGGGPQQRQPAERRRSTCWERDFPPSGKKGSGQGILVGGDFLGAALGDQFTTFAAGPGSQFNQVIGTAEGFLVVFDNQERVAQVA